MPVLPRNGTHVGSEPTSLLLNVHTRVTMDLRGNRLYEAQLVLLFSGARHRGRWS